MKKTYFLMAVVSIFALTLTVAALTRTEREEAAAPAALASGLPESASQETASPMERISSLTGNTLSAGELQTLPDGTEWQLYEGEGVSCAVDAESGELRYVVCDAAAGQEASFTLESAQSTAETYAEALFRDLTGYTLTMEEAFDRGGYTEYVYEWRRIENGMDLDEGVTVSVGADGNLLSAAAFSGGGDGAENAASAVSGAVPAVSEEDAEEKARAWLSAEINPEELGSIELVDIHQQMRDGAPCWAVRMDVHTADGMLEVPYLLYVNMETGEVIWE